MREPSSWPFGPVVLGCGTFGGIGSAPSLIGQGLDVDSAFANVGIATKVAPASVSGGDERFDRAFISASFERSSLDATQLLTALDAAEKLGVVGYEVIQNGYHLLFVDHDSEVQAICAEPGLAYTAYSPLAGGALTGKYRPGRPAPEGTRLALRPQGYDELLTPSVHEAIDRLRSVVAERGLSCGPLALAWLLHDDAVAALITGPARTAPHLGLAAEALRFDMAPDLHAEIGDWFRVALRG